MAGLRRKACGPPQFLREARSRCAVARRVVGAYVYSHTADLARKKELTMDLPLHPKLVHVPIALSVIVPLMAAGIWLAWYRGVLPMQSWLVVVALQALLVGGGVMALRSGEAEEEAVERVVAEQHIEEHEEAAEGFMVAAGLMLALSVAAAAVGLLLKKESLARMLAGVAVLGSLVVLGLGFRVGQAGGELVYKHGAASAYTSSSTATGATAQQREE